MIFSYFIVVFILFYGVGPNPNTSRLESVAEVNGEMITSREFDVHYRRFVEFYRNLFNGKLTQETIRSLNLRSVVIEELIQKRLLLQEARRLGLEVADDLTRSSPSPVWQQPDQAESQVCQLAGMTLDPRPLSQPVYVRF